MIGRYKYAESTLNLVEVMKILHQSIPGEHNKQYVRTFQCPEGHVT